MSFTTINDYIKKARFVRDNIPEQTKLIVAKNFDSIINLNQEQLLEGKTTTGEHIRPFYSEDPYFKSPEAAKRYAMWKQKITPNTERFWDAPNLYIDGTFHKSIRVVFNNDKQPLVKAGSGSFFDDITKKYDDILGLDKENTHEFNYKILKPALDKIIKKYL